MAFDLLPSTFWNYPTRYWDQDDEDWLGATYPGGLSISEDDGKVYVTAAFPGLKEDDIDITFDKGILWLKGEVEQEQDGKDKKYYRRATSSFSYRVSIPTDIDLSKEPEAEYKNGVMTVAFSKSPQSQPRKISVKKK